MTRSLCFAATLVFASHAGAQFDLEEAAAATKASLVSEVKTIAAGSKFTVALKLEHPEHWHSYYKNSGGMEKIPTIQWTLPEGFTAGPIQWPAPEVKDSLFEGFKSFVYVGSPVFLTEITAPATLDSGKTLTFKADAAWQICEQSCNDESAALSVSIQTDAATQADPAVAAWFEKARVAIPAKESGWKFSASEQGSDLLLKVEPDTPQASDPTDFVPDQPFVKSASAGGSIKREGNAWLIQLKRATKDAIEQEIPQGKAFSGILIGAKPVLVPETTIGSGAAAGAGASATGEAAPISKFLPILGGMLLGGLILNLMPCVFPVIGLKIMGFVQQAGSDRKKVALHGITFTLGVLASFGVLSGILFAARSAANSSDKLGWGYQLQNPWVVLCLMLLMFVLALNMFGVFEIGASATSVGGNLQSKQGLGGSFFSGVLATVVATPCSAPFLGAAIGAAIALPAAQFFLAFGFMALGLSLPYLILSVFPRLIDYLPRPGAWMESFKQGMSFLLFATAGYLLWIYAFLIDLENLISPMFGLSLIAAACWVYGRWNLPHRSSRTRATAMVLTVLLVAVGLFLAKPPGKSALAWEHWTLEKQESLLKEGKPVYIDFTATWCATCQYNKKVAYTSDVVKLMKQKGVVVMKGDKSKPTPEIDEEILKYGRAAIPVNVLLQPGKKPIVLPELLSPSIVTGALNEIPTADDKKSARGS